MTDLLERETVSLRGVSTVAGRYVIGEEAMHPGINLFACRLRALSTESYTVTAPVIPQPGETVSASFGPFGRLRGKVERTTSDGFSVRIDATPEQRARIERAIIAFRERIWTGVRERRADHRFMPGNPRSVISRPDCWSQPCLIVDYSSSGAAISAAFQPQVGEVVGIGQVTSEVVRIFDVGFAVRFFERQDIDELESLLEAPEEWTKAMRRVPAPPGEDDEISLHAYGADG